MCTVGLGVSCAASAPWRSTLVVPSATSAKIAQMARAGAESPATVSEVTSGAQLPDGDAANGEFGDFVLDNGVIVVVVGAIDGSPRSGTIVDVAGARRTDGLLAMETRVAGETAEYTTLHTGVDAATGAAFVEVVGEAGDDAVTTRYEVHPRLEAVMIHTAFRRPKTIPKSVKLAVEDRLVGDGHGDERATCNPDFGPGQCLVPGARQSYVLDALDVQGATGERVSDASVVVGVDPASCMEGPRVYTRLLTPLARADLLAQLAARALARGEPLGEVELTILPEPWSPARILEPGRFWFSRRTPGAFPVSLEVDTQYHPGDRVIARIPEGDWYVWFTNDAYVSSANEDVNIHVRGGEKSRFTVGATLRARSPR